MNTEAAIRKATHITEILREDLRSTIQSYAILEANNRIIPPGMKGLKHEYVESYNGIQYAITMSTAMNVARLFDSSDNSRFPLHAQDKASIPVLGAIIKRQDVLDALEIRASLWSSDVELLNEIEPIEDSIIEEIKKTYSAEDVLSFRNDVNSFMNVIGKFDDPSSDEASALHRVRQFRTRRLAHYLIDKDPDVLPYYKDLEILIGVAKTSICFSSLIIDGLGTEFEDRHERNRKNAEGYARCVLKGLQRIARPSVLKKTE